MFSSQPDVLKALLENPTDIVELGLSFISPNQRLFSEADSNLTVNDARFDWWRDWYDSTGLTKTFNNNVDQKNLDIMYMALVFGSEKDVLLSHGVELLVWEGQWTQLGVFRVRGSFAQIATAVDAIPNTLLTPLTDETVDRPVNGQRNPN